MRSDRALAVLVLLAPLLACSAYRSRPPACTDCEIQLRNGESYAVEIWTAYQDGRNAQYHSTLYPGEVRVLPSNLGGRIEVRSKSNATARGGCYPIDGVRDPADKLLRLECRVAR